MPPILTRTAGLILISALVGACTVPSTPVDTFDPYEAQNRRVFAFNTGLDRTLVRPAARGYGNAVPARARRGVSNLSDYLSTPQYIVNDLAQGNVGDAGHNFARMLVNTIFGLALLDPATDAGLEARPTGFGETLHTWGAREGAYVVIPVLGPSTERDATGTAVDIATNPVSYILDSGISWISPAAGVGSGLNTRFEFGDTIDGLLYDSADPYAQARSVYLQNRRFELGEEDQFAFDPFEEFDE